MKNSKEIESSEETQQSRIEEIILNRKKIEEIALEKFKDMKPQIEKAQIIVSNLEKKGLISSTHNESSFCTCKSCSIYKISHQLKK